MWDGCVWECEGVSVGWMDGVWYDGWVVEGVWRLGVESED